MGLGAPRGGVPFMGEEIRFKGGWGGAGGARSVLGGWGGAEVFFLGGRFLFVGEGSWAPYGGGGKVSLGALQRAAGWVARAAPPGAGWAPWGGGRQGARCLRTPGWAEGIVPIEEDTGPDGGREGCWRGPPPRAGGACPSRSQPRTGARDDGGPRGRGGSGASLPRPPSLTVQ